MLVFFDREENFRDELVTVIASSENPACNNDPRDLEAFRNILRRAFQIEDGADIKETLGGDTKVFQGIAIEDPGVPEIAHVAWRVIHGLPYHVAPETCGELLEALLRVFPCEKCREHSKRPAIQNALKRVKNQTTESGVALALVHFHNLVTENVDADLPGVRSVVKESFKNIEEAVAAGRIPQSHLGLLIRVLFA